MRTQLFPPLPSSPQELQSAVSLRAFSFLPVKYLGKQRLLRVAEVMLSIAESSIIDFLEIFTSF